MEKPLVSAIITTHNRCGLLIRAIDAAISQTYHPMEIIVVDDASTDDTCEACKKYGDQINYIQIPPQKSRGGNYARNLGIRSARGEYVAFCDDDDYWLPQKTEKQMRLMLSEDYELVHCGRTLEYVGKHTAKQKDIIPSSDKYGDMSRKILLTICATTTTILAKREALLDVGLFDESLGFWQEYELTIRLAQRKPFGSVLETLCVYRVDTTDKNRLTNKYFSWRKAVKYIHEKHAKLYRQLNWYERLHVKRLIHGDAKMRAKSSRLHLFYCYHFFMNTICRIILKAVKLTKP